MSISRSVLWRRIFTIHPYGLRAALLGAAACGGTPSGSQLEAYIANDRSMIWSGTQVSVCWEPHSIDKPELKAAIADHVTRAYAADTPIRFVGWQTCQSNSEGVHAVLSGGSDGPHTKGIGAKINGMRDGLLLQDPPPQTRDIPNATAAELLVFHKNVALHEFGHAIGLFHEHDRPDSACKQFDSTNGRGEAVASAVGIYDPNSIMNYCLTHDPQRARNLLQFTAADIAGIKQLYAGKPAIGAKMPVFSDTPTDFADAPAASGSRSPSELCAAEGGTVQGSNCVFGANDSVPLSEMIDDGAGGTPGTTPATPAAPATSATTFPNSPIVNPTANAAQLCAAEGGKVEGSNCVFGPGDSAPLSGFDSAAGAGSSNLGGLDTGTLSTLLGGLNGGLDGGSAATPSGATSASATAICQQEGGSVQGSACVFGPGDSVPLSEMTDSAIADQPTSSGVGQPSAADAATMCREDGGSVQGSACVFGPGDSVPLSQFQ